MVAINFLLAKFSGHTVSVLCLKGLSFHGILNIVYVSEGEHSFHGFFCDFILSHIHNTSLIYVMGNNSSYLNYNIIWKSCNNTSVPQYFMWLQEILNTCMYCKS